MPLADTVICSWKTIVYSNHGKGNPTVTSKILDPTDDDTAMSPKPFLATITLVIRSGIEVPAAKKVRPIISGGMLKASPVTGPPYHKIRKRCYPHNASKKCD